MPSDERDPSREQWAKWIGGPKEVSWGPPAERSVRFVQPVERWTWSGMIGAGLLIGSIVLTLIGLGCAVLR